ncbi:MULTISPECIES: SDR family NAD(P)-dependent oxidoreductase [Novosphingobium]|jgi:NAD(P)-dependent dehydrogenase (short-subunit alcohol dehydrogenase family)|uniref:Short-chain dehydrogenase/reductase SDR n=1 Tax=Novosphingobium subterraneum TaxID=48936 RepID=A0A0B8ZKQ8_9SPHN|nr:MULTISPECIES: SDR family NAD(P)-dependent oxidoreductase [Novosphingobium]KHS46816.1 short-chain dehydrogenase/reductase SDR [Novosphingobium subterraneum]QOV92807.1 SDR family NAD(P)-dependent oxidoreductase [Novosphingobium sp. ES2-1]
MSLAGQVALVTGASRGIGAATAKALAAAGAHVVLVARNAKDLEKIEEEIFEAGGSATIAPVDLSEADSIARLATAISGRWKALDILVINAAVLPTLTPVWQIDAREFNQALTLNVLATQALLAGFDGMLRKSQDARVIGVTSSVGATPRAYWGAYGASKAAFDNLLGSYGQEVRNTAAIRVAVVDPGATRTKMRARAYPGEDPQTVKAPEVVADRIVTLLGEQFASPHRIRVNQD